MQTACPLLVLGSLPNLLHVAGPLLELPVFLFHVREGSTFCPGFWAYCNNLNKSVRLIKKGLLWSGGGGGGGWGIRLQVVFVLFLFLLLKISVHHLHVWRKWNWKWKGRIFFRQCTSWFAGILNFTLLCTGLPSLLKAHNMLVCWVPLVCYPS